MFGFFQSIRLTYALGAAVLAGLMAVFGTTLLQESPTAAMTLLTEQTGAVVGEEVVVTLKVSSQKPVNVFAGEIKFDPAVLHVEQIDYNTSVADLWAEKPWFSNGEGTINFGGGTTRTGGFVGTGSLLTVIFRADSVVSATALELTEPRILLHDGLGSDAAVATPVDTILEIEPAHNNLVTETSPAVPIAVVSNAPSTDLNGDGQQTTADISVFMLNIGSSDARFDFNLDGRVGLADLNILLEAE